MADRIGIRRCNKLLRDTKYSKLTRVMIAHLRRNATCRRRRRSSEVHRNIKIWCQILSKHLRDWKMCVEKREKALCYILHGKERYTVPSQIKAWFWAIDNYLYRRILENTWADITRNKYDLYIWNRKQIYWLQ